MRCYARTMDYLNESKYQGRQQRYLLRSLAVGRWARKMLWFTALGGLFAVWQHRELAPPVHDGMYTMAAVAKDIYGGAHETRGVVQSYFSGPSGSGSNVGYNPITQWLLDNR